MPSVNEKHHIVLRINACCFVKFKPWLPGGGTSSLLSWCSLKRQLGGYFCLASSHAIRDPFLSSSPYSPFRTDHGWSEAGKSDHSCKTHTNTSRPPFSILPDSLQCYCHADGSFTITRWHSSRGNLKRQWKKKTHSRIQILQVKKQSPNAKKQDANEEIQLRNTSLRCVSWR